MNDKNNPNKVIYVDVYANLGYCVFISTIKIMIKGNSAKIAAILSVALCSCNGTDLAIYYNSEALPLESYVAIPKGKQPRVIEVIDFKAAQERYLASGYIAIGSMSFVATRITQGEVADFAK